VTFNSDSLTLKSVQLNYSLTEQNSKSSSYNYPNSFTKHERQNYGASCSIKICLSPWFT